MKRILLIIIAFTSVTIVSAQIQIGVEAGLNLASQKLTPAASQAGYSGITSFNAGAFVGIPIMKGLTLQPELMYSGEGTHSAEEDGDTSRIDFNYFNIPVLLKYTSTFGVFAEVGPQIGFVVSAIQHNHTLSSTNDLKPLYNQTDFSAVFGVGYISPINLGIDFRYNLGFLNLIKAAGQYKIKNQVFQISLFYIFKMKKKNK